MLDIALGLDISWIVDGVDPINHLLVNDMVATIMGQYLYRLLHRLPIHSFVTYAGIGAFISSRRLPVCREELEGA